MTESLGILTKGKVRREDLGKEKFGNTKKFVFIFRLLPKQNKSNGVTIAVTPMVPKVFR